MKNFLSPILTLIIFLISSTLFAQTLSTINYQGIARTVDGVVLKSQNITITFNIYEEGNNIPIYEQKDIVFTNSFGVFSTKIGPIGTGNSSQVLANLNWNNGNQKYIETLYNFDNDQTNDLISTRIPFQSVPYAFHAQSATTAKKLENFSNFWEPQNSDIIYTSGNIGIGNPNFIPQTKLHIDGGNLRIDNGDIVVGNGNIYLENSSSGIYMKAPNGSCYLIKINNIGEIQTELKACP